MTAPTRRPRSLAALALACLALGACVNKLPHEPTALISAPALKGIDELWSIYLAANDTRQYHIFAPDFDGDHLYTAVPSGFFYKFTLDERGVPKLALSIDLGEEIHSGPTVNDDVAYLCVGDNRLLGLSSEDGSIVDDITLSTYCVAPPIFGDDRIFLRLRDGTAIALNEQREVAWRQSQGVVNLSLDGNSPLLLHNDALYFATDASRLHSLSPRRGDPYWLINIGTPKTYTEIGLILDIDAPIEVWGKYLIVSAYQSRTLMVNSLTGREIWELDLSTRTGVSVDNEGDLAWLSDTDGSVHCIELGSGEILWSSDTLKYRTLSRPVKVGDRIVVADRFGYLHILDAAGGSYLARGRIRVMRTERDPVSKRRIKGRYQPHHKQTQLFEAWEGIFIAQDLSGRLAFYRIEP